MVFIINKQNSFQEFQSLSYQTKTLFIFKFNSSVFFNGASRQRGAKIFVRFNLHKTF